MKKTVDLIFPRNPEYKFEYYNSLEVDLNYPIRLQQNENKENHIRLCANGAYKFHNSHLRANLKLSYDKTCRFL